MIRLGSRKYGSTHIGLRATTAGMPSDIDLLSGKCHPSVETSRKHDHPCAEAVTLGLRWKVLMLEVRARYPEAMHV